MAKHYEDSRKYHNIMKKNTNTYQFSACTEQEVSMDLCCGTCAEFTDENIVIDGVNTHCRINAMFSIQQPCNGKCICKAWKTAQIDLMEVL